MESLFISIQLPKLLIFHDYSKSIRVFFVLLHVTKPLSVKNMTLQEAIKQRHTVRRYISSPLEQAAIDSLSKNIEECNREGNLHIQLVLNEKRAFTGVLSYGQFSGVENYIIMAGKMCENLDEKIGYYGQLLVLQAQTLGLNTCWVALTYRKIKEFYNLEEDEKIVCVIALGYGKTQGKGHKIKRPEQVSNVSEDTPEWFLNGVNSALLAPTAINQQKFFFEYSFDESGNRHVVRAKAGFSMFGYTEIDLGIAKRNFEIGAGNIDFIWKNS